MSFLATFSSLIGLISLKLHSDAEQSVIHAFVDLTDHPRLI